MQNPMPVIQDELQPVLANRMRASELSSWYGTRQVLREVSLDIPTNSIVALVGPSGCGKSTFLRCLNRMNDNIRGFRSQGRILLDGVDVASGATDLAELRRVVGMVFQQPNPFPMSIFDNIALAVQEHAPGIRKGELADIVERSLTQANLWTEVKDCLGQSALALSGGQQQRLCIARALAIEPEVLLLDEPCASLDPISTAHVERLLLQLSSDYTVVIVTHNLPQALRVSDSMAFFYMGELMETGNTKQMSSAPRLAQTAEYFAGAFG